MTTRRAPHPRFSIIIPAHNEQERIGATLASYVGEFADSEIIVVLNGCTDDTHAVVEAVAAGHDHVNVIDIPDALGKGGAVRAGFLMARSQVVGYVDADGSTPAGEMRRLCEALGPNDGIIGSRWIPHAVVEIKQPWLRRLASRSFNLLVVTLFGLKFNDTQCGAKVFRRGALRNVMRDVETANFAFDVDLLFAMKRLGLRVREEPTYWIDVPGGSKVKLVSTSLKMFLSVVRLRLKHSFLSVVLPVYDRLFPTKPVRTRDHLRILVINWRDPKHPWAGGAETYLFEQARRWQQWGNHVEWLSAGFPGGASRDAIDGIPIRRVGNAYTVYFHVPFVYLREFRDRFDVVIDSSNGIPFFSPLFSLKPKICIVYHVHRDAFNKYLPKWMAALFAWSARLVPLLYRGVHFVTISDDTLREMRSSGVGTGTTGLVHCGVDKRLVPGEKAATPTVLYLGRLKAHKRIDLLIETFAKVRERVPGAVLEIAGTGDARPSLEALAKRLGLEGAVRFEGFVDDDRKRELLQRAWVTATLSEIEGWGISPIEGNACGTPAIAYDVPGLREAIVHGESGLIVPIGGDVSDAIVSVLQDDALRARLQRGALRRAELFSWDKAARDMFVEIMRAIVGIDVRSVDLDGNWTYFRSNSPAATEVSSLVDTRWVR